MSEYISREELLEKEKHQEDWNMFLDYVTIDDVKSIPPADVREIVHGHWELVNPLQSDDGGAYRCSVCGTGVWHIKPKYWKGCPWCLAIMDGEPKGEKGEI